MLKAWIVIIVENTSVWKHLLLHASLTFLPFFGSYLLSIAWDHQLVHSALSKRVLQNYHCLCIISVWPRVFLKGNFHFLQNPWDCIACNRAFLSRSFSLYWTLLFKFLQWNMTQSLQMLPEEECRNYKTKINVIRCPYSVPLEPGNEVSNQKDIFLTAVRGKRAYITDHAH